MARVKDPNKEPGRLKQVWQVLKMTVRHDRASIWMLILAFLLPLAVAIVLGVVLNGAQPVMMVLWVILGVFAGVLAAMIVLGRRAERAAYSQIEGQPGAVGAVLQNGLRRSWIANEMPIAVSPKTQDAVYRIVGRGGIVLIGEGPRSRTQRMLEDERRKHARVVPNVPITFIHVGPDADSTTLYGIKTELRQLKRALRTQEIRTVNARLESLVKAKGLLPIPKGIDPMRARAQRAR